MTPFITRAATALGILSASAFAVAAEDCANRGALDELYCDANGDLVADTPTDPAELRNPDTLVFAYTPVEDPAVYADIWAPFITHMEEVTGKNVQFFAVQSNSAEVEAMRSGRLHVAGFSTGPTPFAVNLAGAVPFAIMGAEDGQFGYKLQVFTQADSDIKEVKDLAGRRVAHTSPTSNSGIDFIHFLLVQLSRLVIKNDTPVAHADDAIAVFLGFGHVMDVDDHRQFQF